MKVFLHVHFYGELHKIVCIADGDHYHEKKQSVFVCNIKGIVFYEAHVVPDCVILLAEDSFRSKLVIRNTVDPI